jgi:hypothetical protein
MKETAEQSGGGRARERRASLGAPLGAVRPARRVPSRRPLLPQALLNLEAHGLVRVVRQQPSILAIATAVRPRGRGRSAGAASGLRTRHHTRQRARGTRQPVTLRAAAAAGRTPVTAPAPRRVTVPGSFEPA